MHKPTLLCIAHRGAMGHAPENTLRSVAKALELGALCVEIDVYLVDGQLVVFHDERLERTTDGNGYLRQQRFAYLRSLDAGDGQLVPTLAEVCALIGSRANLNIELKDTVSAAAVADLLAGLCQRGQDIKQFLLSSFYHRELLVMKQLLPEVKLGALIKGIPVDNARFAEDLGAFSVHPCLACAQQSFVEDAHARGLKVFVYGVDHPQDIERMQALAVDGVFTGFPERVLEYYSQPDVSHGW